MANCAPLLSPVLVFPMPVSFSLSISLSLLLSLFSFCPTLSHDLSLSSCLNNGTCVEGINTHSCRCRTGFSGIYCEREIDECESQPCKNGGTCTNDVGTYRCTCPSGFTGTNCQVQTLHTLTHRADDRSHQAVPNLTQSKQCNA